MNPEKLLYEWLKTYPMTMGVGSVFAVTLWAQLGPYLEMPYLLLLLPATLGVFLMAHLVDRTIKLVGGAYK